MGLNLITAAEYKAYKGINNPNQDAEINAIIPKISSLVKNYCRRSFIDYYEDPKVEQFSGSSNPTEYYIRETPLVSISSVEYSTDYGNTYTTLVNLVDYVYDTTKEAIIPLSTKEFDPKPNSYRITYKAGYEVVPEDLKLSLLDLVTYYLKNDSAIHSPKAPGTNSVQIEYITTTSLPAHIRRVLDLYVADYT